MLYTIHVFGLVELLLLEQIMDTVKSLFTYNYNLKNNENIEGIF